MQQSDGPYLQSSGLDQSNDALSRRTALKAGAAALSGAAALMAQATDDKKTSGAARKFRAWVTRGSGRNNGSVEELTLLPIKGRQVVVRTEAAHCCYSLSGRVLGLSDRNPGPPGTIQDVNQPVIQGHGGVGIVESVGPEVRRVKVGDRVIVSVTPQCGQCYQCLHGRPDRCQSLSVIQNTPIATMKDGRSVIGLTDIGGLAEMMVIYEEWCVPVFTNVSPVELTMLHCSGATGLGTTMNLAPVEPGSDVVVLGCGPVGLSAVQGARINGAAQIIAVEPIRARRELALKLGATAAIDPNAEGNKLVEKILDMCKGPTDRIFAGGRDWRDIAFARGADFVIEAVGGDQAVPKVEVGPDPTGILPLLQAWEVCRTGGCYMTTGVNQKGNVAFPANRWSNGSKNHLPSQYGGCHMMRDLPRYARLIERGLFDAKSLVTSRWKLEQTREAYQAVADRTTVAAILDFS
jgi:S-(hydroxymethyl)glutathione dehydrogenase/alcohol dehydrogenase